MNFYIRSVRFGAGVFAAFLLTALLNLQAAAQAGASSPGRTSRISQVDLKPCEIAGIKESARCGKYEVYEDRQAKTGRKIELNILVIPALSATPKPDPIFYLEGGPGVSAVASGKSPIFSGFVKLWRTDRDVVFVDQRGTGESNPLRCDLADPNDMNQYFNSEDSLERLGKLDQCRDKLSKIANLKLYTTPIAMDDLDDVRQALGYDKINLFGGSYGTRAALVYIRRHPDHVRSAVLDGVAPTNFKLPLPFAKGVQNALEHLFAECAEDASCHKAFPDVKADLTAALSKFDKGPVTATAFNPVTKRPQAVNMTRGAYIDVVRLMLYQPQLTGFLPLIIHQSAGGNFGGAATLGFAVERQLAGTLAGGMSLSVICAEDAPFITEADMKQATEGTFYGDYRAKALIASCKEWPRGTIPANYHDPVKSDVPVLMISGDVDPVTPPWLAADALKYLPHGRQIVAKNWSHSSMSDCGNKLISDFFERGSADGLDAGCMQNGSKPVFNTGEVALAPTKHAEGTVKTSYAGLLEVGAQKITLVLNLFKAPDGTYSASLDSPEQNAKGLAVDVITVKDGAVHFEMKQIAASYDGKFSADGSEIVGEFKQGVSLPLTLKKTATGK